MSHGGPPMGAGEYPVRFESIGVYLPPHIETTEQVVANTVKARDLPLRDVTGIALRHVADGEGTVDLATHAALRTLRGSRWRAHQIDIVVSCCVSRGIDPGYLEWEPSIASRVAANIGASQAICFDLGNACAGFFTAVHAVRSLLATGAARSALIVSGEYITPILRTAQLECEGVGHPQMASLTVGDCGAAVIVEPSPDPALGLVHLELYTDATKSGLCVARGVGTGSGFAMYSEPMRLQALAMRDAWQRMSRALDVSAWQPEDVDLVIPHQTSAVAIAIGAERLRAESGGRVRAEVMTNVARFGNTASTTHVLALHEYLRSPSARPGQKLVFVISGSGYVGGLAMYALDDIAARVDEVAA